MQRKRRLRVIGSAVTALAAAGTGTAIAVSGDDDGEGQATARGAAAGPVFWDPTTIDNRYRFEDVPGVTIESNRVEEVELRNRVAGRLLTDVIWIQESLSNGGLRR
jgi:hypothetical protein